MTDVRVLGVDGSSTGPGKTAAVVAEVLAGARREGAATTLVSLGPESAAGVDAAVAAVRANDAFVFGTPVYRASHGALLKALLERTPRGMWGEEGAPLRGAAVGIVATGATLHHFLALADLRNTLSAFFAAYVVPPGLYLPADAFDADGALAPKGVEEARELGARVVRLQRALAADALLQSAAPQA